MIEEILGRLERIDHKEYCGGFEFADSATFEEMGRCFDERKQLANYMKELQQENKQLKEQKKQVTKILKGSAMFYCEEDRQWLEELFKRILEILGEKENER